MLNYGPQKKNWRVRKEKCFKNQEKAHQKSIVAEVGRT